MLKSKLDTWKFLGRIFSDETLHDTEWTHELSKSSWQTLVETALNQMVAPELYCRLTELGLQSIPPSMVMEALEGAYELNELFHDDLRAMFEDICGICNSAGSCPIILKGAIDAISTHDSVNASRMVSDLDILLDSAVVPDIFHKLLIAGYRRDILDLSQDTSGHLDAHHHYPPLWHPSIRQYVELHGRLGSSSSHEWLTAQMAAAVVPRKIGELEFMVPNTYARLQHNVAHHYIANIIGSYKAPCFRQLLDFCRLAKRWKAEIPELVLIDSCCNDEGIASGLRVNAAISNLLFRSEIPHGSLKPVETRFVAKFQSRLELPILNLIYTYENELWRQIYRLRNWRKVFTKRFYQLQYIMFVTYFR